VQFIKRGLYKYAYFLLTEKYHLTYKFVKTECKLVRSILSVHCFREVKNFDFSWHAQKEKQLHSNCGSNQSRSQSFIPLDQRSENESSGSIHFEITIGNNRSLVIRLTAQSQSASMACYGACLKWMLPELSFSDRWSRGSKLWEWDWDQTLYQWLMFPQRNDRSFSLILIILFLYTRNLQNIYKYLVWL